MNKDRRRYRKFKVSKLIKVCAYIFLFGYILREANYIAVNTSYLNTGELMGVQSMMMMVWACFIAFLFAAIIFGIGEIVEYYENKNLHLSDTHTKSADDLTK